MVLTPVVEEEVDRIIQQPPSKKSSDTNLMSTWLIKQCSKHIIVSYPTLADYVHSLSFQNAQ
ncbi:hypothetical protein J6590_099439 [Homalodisca vitripennis]|nr:hypothetical protein J6590_099439 [Homalodisca vitripennis]